MSWARWPARRELLGTAAREVHGGTMLLHLMLHQVPVQSCQGRACRGSPSALGGGGVGAGAQQQDRGTGAPSARWDPTGSAGAAHTTDFVFKIACLTGGAGLTLLQYNTVHRAAAVLIW